MEKTLIPWSVLDEFKKVITCFRGRVDYVVGILRGGAFPAICASHTLEVPVYWFKASSYTSGGQKMPLVVSNMDAPLRFQDKVLVVDDIYDTGETLRFVTDFISSLTGRSPFRAVLVTKRPVECIEKGVLFVREVQGWVVFPWEVKEGVNVEKVHGGGSQEMGGAVPPR